MNQDNTGSVIWRLFFDSRQIKIGRAKTGVDALIQAMKARRFIMDELWDVVEIDPSLWYLSIKKTN